MHSVHLLLKMQEGPRSFFLFLTFFWKKKINNSRSFIFLEGGGGEFKKQNHPPATPENPLRYELNWLQQADFVANMTVLAIVMHNHSCATKGSFVLVFLLLSLLLSLQAYCKQFLQHKEEEKSKYKK